MIDEDEVFDQQEEIIDEVVNEEEILPLVNDEEQGEQESVDDEVTQRAKKFGHLSKEEWIAQGRDPAQYKTPEEFDKTGKVIEQLYSLKKKVDQRDRELEAVIAYQKRTEERAYERAKQDLQSQLAASKDDMDMDGVAHYTRELVRLEDNENNTKVYQANQARQSAQESFIERNQHWFNDRNPDLKQRAIEIDNEIKDVYPNATFDEIALKIEKRMQYDYPERVLNSNGRNGRPSIQPGASSVNKTAVTRKSSFKDLSQEHRDTYQVYKRINPKITEADFIQRLKLDGELK